MSEQHVMRVRDLIAELQRQPEDVEVAVLAGETRYFISQIKYGCGQVEGHRRTVNLVTDGEDTIKKLEGELNDVETEKLTYEDLLEQFDQIMSDDDLEEYQRRNKLKDLHDELKAELAKS